MSEEFEMEESDSHPEKELRKMPYDCLKCGNDTFYVVPGENTISCANCLNLSPLVLYSCDDCCPSGYRFCPVCRLGAETSKGCFLT